MAILICNLQIKILSSTNLFIEITDLPEGATTPRNLTLIFLQNGKTLEVLDLSRGYGLRPKWIELITRHCVNLKEANFNYYGLKEDSINYLVKNLTTKIERLCLSCTPLKDEQVKVLVSRCNKISVLDLTLVTSITGYTLSKALIFLSIDPKYENIFCGDFTG